jgi:hypothetical protein
MEETKGVKEILDFLPFFINEDSDKGMTEKFLSVLKLSIAYFCQVLRFFVEVLWRRAEPQDRTVGWVLGLEEEKEKEGVSFYRITFTSIPTATILILIVWGVDALDLV